MREISSFCLFNSIKDIKIINNKLNFLVNKNIDNFYIKCFIKSIISSKYKIKKIRKITKNNFSKIYISFI